MNVLLENWFFLLVLLLCVVMHLFGHGHGHGHEHAARDDAHHGNGPRHNRR